MKRWILRSVWATGLIVATVVTGGALAARQRLPDLEAWHRHAPADWNAADSETATLADYLRREDAVFRDVQDRIALPPTRIALISPMIGVAPFAWLARVISLLGPIPYFEKARWLDVVPEYNPFKYNSFPANAALQSWRLTTTLQAQILRLGKAGRLKQLPPVLAFQSLVDATVSTAAVVHALYDQLDENGSELVFFDINRLSGLEPFIDPASATLLSRLTDATPRRYGRSLVTNAARDSLDVVERSIGANQTEIATRPLGLAWPPEMFSLSHIALPFPQDDEVYGTNPRPSSSDMVRLGALSPRGERAVLTVPVDTLMRVSCNPFFPYLATRLTAWTESGMLRGARQKEAEDAAKKTGKQ